jgi:hypothetical protein
VVVAGVIGAAPAVATAQKAGEEEQLLIARDQRCRRNYDVPATFHDAV